MIEIDQQKKNLLLELGVISVHSPTFWLPDNCWFEPPCNFNWISIDNSIRMGAFTSAKSGYFRNVRIGRYSSLEEGLQIGRGSHPVVTGSTSPVLYGSYEQVTLIKDARGDDWNSEMRKHFLGSEDSLFGSDLKNDENYSNQYSDHTLIGNDVSIGFGAFIMPGISIGDGAVVKPMAVVTKNIPPYAVVAGSPARIVEMRFSDSLIDKYQKIQWWRYAFWDLRHIPVDDPDIFLSEVETSIEGGLVEYNPKIIEIAHI